MLGLAGKRSKKKILKMEKNRYPKLLFIGISSNSYSNKFWASDASPPMAVSKMSSNCGRCSFETSPRCVRACVRAPFTRLLWILQSNHEVLQDFPCPWPAGAHCILLQRCSHSVELRSKNHNRTRVLARPMRKINLRQYTEAGRISGILLSQVPLLKQA